MNIEALSDIVSPLESKSKKHKNLYGDGKAGFKIVDILSRIKIDKKLMQKRLVY